MKNRSYPTRPILSVAVIIVGPKGILLIKRDKPPYKGLWNIISGVVHLGETQEEAVIREVREETGITGEVIRLIDSGDVITFDDDQKVEFHYVANVYLFRALTDVDQGKIKEYDIKWFQPDSIPVDEMVESVANALKKLAKHLQQIINQN